MRRWSRPSRPQAPRAMFEIAHVKRSDPEQPETPAARPARSLTLLPALALLVLLAAGLTPGPALAQVLGRIAEIQIEGNQVADRELVVSSLPIKVGDTFTREDVKRAIKKLHGLGLFDDIDIYGEEIGAERVRLIVSVTEKRRLAKIVFSGTKKVDETTLREKLTIKEGQIFDDRLLTEQIGALERTYKEKGYAQVKISTEVAPVEVDGPGRVAVTFNIVEGQKVKISAIRITGAEGLDRDLIMDGVKTKKKGRFFGGDFKEETFREDLERIAQNLHNSGYKDAPVPTYELYYDEEKPRLEIEIRVTTGPLYTMGQATWEGEDVLSESELNRLLAWDPGDPYSEEKVNEVVSNAYSAYAERGYIYVGIDPQRVTNDRTVGVRFRIAEGEPSMVRQVRVTGNTRTKEKVIRRELVIKPGDKFSRSALVRSQRDVFQLGFFEDVRVDFERAGVGSSDIDIVFDVKEKQTGTLQAGAGFSSEGGLTGFIEMGHNNLFGNGQQMRFKWENGSRRNNQELSFTEPWFLDTPTSVGFDLFNALLVRDIYDDRRRGGAIRLGRRLPWPDYTRGFLSYRIENVNIDNIAPGITIGGPFPRTTSSVAVAFTRNSTDNPFYPRTGVRTTWRSEFAGGILGGNVDYQKHVLDTRTYIPTSWRPVVMLRGRAGILDGYGDPSTVPDYETFRLGGTTTNYLRGYRDYDVVPRGNDRFPGGRAMITLTAELQFLIAEPLHGLFFFDAGDTWNSTDEFRLTDLRKGAGFGIRLEIPLLGQIGFDYGYGFDQIGGGRWEPHFLIGPQF
jgi:outer membrane protein insertion porin family